MRFSDGADAATALGQRNVRAKIVLLDVGLPSLDGFGVLQVLRSQGILDETRVIMLTARSSEDEMLRAIGLGATEHITKPFSVPVLLARLDQTHVEVRGMSATELIIIMLVAIGSAIAAVLVTVWVSSLVQAHRVRIEPTLGEARHAIVAALSGDPQQSADALANLSRFSQRYIVSVMLDLAPSVSGTSRSVLVSLGEQTGVIERARTGVDSRRWSTRLYSARVLTAFGVESAAMHTLLGDRSPEVRAQAAAWCVCAP